MSYIYECDKKMTWTHTPYFHSTSSFGKGGQTRLPSDVLSHKELEALSGPVKVYKLSKPMTWEQFLDMPDDLKKEYVTKLRDRFNVPDALLAKAMGASPRKFVDILKTLKVGNKSTAYFTLEQCHAFADWLQSNKEEA